MVDRQEKKTGHEPIVCFAVCPSASIFACFIAFISCIKMVELCRATTEQPIHSTDQMCSGRVILPVTDCREHLASSKRGLLNTDVSLEILQDKITLRLKSMEGIFQSSAKLSKSEHT